MAGRLPPLNLLGTCWGGGSHVVSFVWRAATRETRTRARGAGRGSRRAGPASRTALAVPAAPTGRPGRERRVCGRAGEFAAEPSYPEERIGPPTRRHDASSPWVTNAAPPAHLPAPWKGECLRRANAGVACSPGWPWPAAVGRRARLSSRGFLAASTNQRGRRAQAPRSRPRGPRPALATGAGMLGCSAPGRWGTGSPDQRNSVPSD